MIAVQHRAAPGGNAAGTGLREGDKMQITDGKDYIPQVRELIREYTDALGRDLSLQHIGEELQDPARGRRLGNALVEAIVAHAQRAGYREMVLDTLVPM